MLKKKKNQLIHSQYLGKLLTSTKYLLVLVFFCLILLPSFGQTNAYSIKPAIEEFQLEPLEKAQGVLYFTNTTTQDQNFKIYSHRYKPQREEILDERDFVKTDIQSITVTAGETAEIPYEVEIPDDTLPGSYFSIIVVEGEDDRQNQTGSSIGINYGLGALVAMHVVYDIDIADIFINETEIELNYTKTLIPFRTVIEYKIKNNSKYTFQILGQLGIQSKNQKTQPTYFQINPKGEKLYPNTELSFSFIYYGRLRDFIENKNVVARTGNQFSNNLKENTIEIPYLTQTIIVATALIIIFSTVIVATILLRKQKGNRKQKKKEKTKTK